MIDEVVSMLRDKLNTYFRFKTNVSENIVNFIEAGKPDSTIFPNNNIVPLMINIEEDKSLWQVERFEIKMGDNIRGRSTSTLYINLFVLFICHFSDYKQSLKFLTLIIRFFQRNRVMSHLNSPEMPDELEKLTLELVTMTRSQQSEIWGSLKSAYLPSVMYKVGMLILQDTESFEVENQIEELNLKMKSL